MATFNMAKYAIDLNFNKVLKERYPGKDGVSEHDESKEMSMGPEEHEGLESDEQEEGLEDGIEQAEEDEHIDQDDEEEFDDDEDADFDIADHLERIVKLLGLALSEGKPSGMLEKMSHPSLIESMPFGDMVVGDETKAGLDGMHGKIMKIKKHGHGPMEVEEKEFGGEDHDGDLDEDDMDCCGHGVEEAREAIADIRRVGNFRAAAVGDGGPDFRRSLRRAHDIAKAIREPADVTPEVVAAIANRVNPVRFASKLDRRTRSIISNVLSDLSAYIEKPEYFHSIAERIKVAYLGLGDGGTMRRHAYYITREDSAGEKGYNICPKFASLKGPDAKVPISWSDCREQCIEGKPEDDGSVSCKFASWLENVADSHVKAMARLDEHKNPANKDMELRLADGEREHPRKRVLRSLEQRLSEDYARGREWDGIKKAQSIPSGLSGKMMNTEALLEEVLKGGDVKRDDSGNMDTTEAKLWAATGDRGGTDMIAEEKLNKKRDDSAHGEGATTEARLVDDDYHDDSAFRDARLIDELIEQEYPRTDSALGTKGKD